MPPAKSGKAPSKGEADNAGLLTGAISHDYCIVYKPGHDKTLAACGNLKAALEAEIPDVRVCVGDGKAGADGDDSIQNSRNIILLLTSEFTSNEVLLSQMRLALSLRKHIIRVVETLLPFHAPDWQTLVDECPSDLTNVLGSKETCLSMSHGAGKKQLAVEILEASMKNSKGQALLCSQSRNDTEVKKNSLGGLVYQRGNEITQVFDKSLVTFCALCGVALPGAGSWTKKWAICVWIILSVCALMCFSRFGTTVGPAFLDYATIIQISVDHPALVLFLLVSFKLVRSNDVADLVDNQITCTPMVRFLKLKQKIATALSVLLTVSLTLFGWTGYLPGFFHDFYLGNDSGTLVLYGVAHGMIWVVILPIFFGSLFAALLIMFVVQELAYLGVFSTFDRLHKSIQQDSLHKVAGDRRELKIDPSDLAKFKSSYMAEWERNVRLQTLGAVPFMVFWLLEFCLMSWSIWSLSQGFDADDSDERVPRLQSHWNLLARLTFFMVHSLWFGAGALIVGFLPFGVNFYGWRMRRLCRQLNIKDASIRQELMDFLRAHDLNIRVLILRTPLCYFPLYAIIVTVNIVGFQADSARLLGAYFAL